MKYLIENNVLSDKHLIYYNNYKLEFRFFIFKCWVFNIDYVRNNDFSILGLPTLDIVINKF